jgi:Ribose/Galactose Isomerase
MRIAIGSDHAGFDLKGEAKAFLLEENHEVLDVGTYSKAPVDYPDYAEAVATALRDTKRMATCLEFGPRFLHSTGQAYKGGQTRGCSCRSPAMTPSICPCRDRGTRSAWSRRHERDGIFRFWSSGTAALCVLILAQMSLPVSRQAAIIAALE